MVMLYTYKDDFEIELRFPETRQKWAKNIFISIKDNIMVTEFLDSDGSKRDQVATPVITKNGKLYMWKKGDICWKPIEDATILRAFLDYTAEKELLD